MSARRRRFLLAAFAGVAILAGLGVAAYFLWFQPTLPGPGSPRYLKYVEDFEVGVAALDLGSPGEKPGESVNAAAPDLAYRKLTAAVETIPEEPAGWANRGLWNLRKNLLDEAEKDLRRAEQLAPDNPDIQNLLGLLAKQRGLYPDAVAHFRKALDKEAEGFADSLCPGRDAGTGRGGRKRQGTTEVIRRGAGRFSPTIFACCARRRKSPLVLATGLRLLR